MLMLKQPLSDMLTMVQGMEGHLLRENWVETVLESLVLLTGTLPAASKIERQIIKPL
jgi:hypothetical protein